MTLLVSLSRLPDDDEDENKRDRKSRPARHTDTNRRRNNELSSAKPRLLAQEYQKPVRPSSFAHITSCLSLPSARPGRYVSFVLCQ